MTFGEAKDKILKLLDEQKAKSDLLDKLPRFCDMGQKEVALYYPIIRSKEYSADEPRTLPEDCREPILVVYNGETFPYVNHKPLPSGAFTLRYEAYPADVPNDVQPDFVFDLPDEAMDAVIFFAAAQTQSMEYDQRFFQSFYAQYQGKVANLSGLAQRPVAVIVGGDFFAI